MTSLDVFQVWTLCDWCHQLSAAPGSCLTLKSSCMQPSARGDAPRTDGGPGSSWRGRRPFLTGHGAQGEPATGFLFPHETPGLADPAPNLALTSPAGSATPPRPATPPRVRRWTGWFQPYFHTRRDRAGTLPRRVY